MKANGNLQGKVALVTGGARRIGEAICRELASRGVSVVVHYHHSEAGAIAMNRSLKNGVCSVRGDLSTPQGCEWVFREAQEWMGRVDILVNNASRFEVDESVDVEALRAVNLEAPLQLGRLMAEAGGEGNIIQMLDSRILLNPSGPFKAYAATKRELAESVERLAREYAPRLRVNGVAPGPVLAPEGAREAAGPLLSGRRPTPEDVARTVAFLAETPAVTGQILFVDGGQHLLADRL
jgi:pteridine reductase